MDVTQGILLGILQGATEFLPVSSSGHLVLGQLCLGIREPMLFFDISVHMGTLFAVCLVYFRDIQKICTAFIGFLSRMIQGERFSDILRSDEDFSLGIWILAASVPTAILGFFFKGFEEILFSSYLVVGIMLLITGMILAFSARLYQRKTFRPLSLKRSLLLGAAQGFAVLPGISRSGTTIVTGMALGLSRDKAARFSFLMSIPAIAGAQVLGIKDLAQKGMVIEPAVIWGTLAAFLTGFMALKVLLSLLNKGKLHYFSIYCLLAGLVVLILGNG